MSLAYSHSNRDIRAVALYNLLGINYPFLAHFGARVQLRGLKYKTPDFHQLSLDTHTLRTTLEPTVSVYYRF